jgi:hypothetical protein
MLIGNATAWYVGYMPRPVTGAVAFGFILPKCTAADAGSIWTSLPDRIDVSRAAFIHYQLSGSSQ